MRMLIVGAGAVGESILRILKKRDEKREWLEFAVVSDFDEKRAKEVCKNLNDDNRFIPEFVDAKSKENMKILINKYNIDFVMDATSPFLSNFIFDAAFESGVNYGNMGTWSVPKDDPKFGLGIENSYIEPMTKYNFDQHEKWKENKQMACICMGIDPGVVNVFARYAAEYVFDEIKEIHVKDGGNLTVPGAAEDDIVFGFNVWTVIDECMNPNVEWDKSKGGFIVEDAFAGEEKFMMPEVGENTLIKIEHEETVTMPRYLEKFGLERVTYKIALDDNLINALKVINKLGLRSTKPIQVSGLSIIPRDVVAACAPQPKDIGNEMTGMMCVGIHCKGIKDGKNKEIIIYQTFDNQKSIRDWGMQAVVAQTGFGAAISIELIAKGIWKDYGVFSPEYFNPIPYLEIMEESGFNYKVKNI